MIVLNLEHYPVVENRAPNEQLNRDVIQRGEGGFLMGIRNLGVALVLSVSLLWAQSDYERRRTEAVQREIDRKLEAEQLWPRRSEMLSRKWEVPSKQEKAHKEFKKALKAVRKKKYEKALGRLKKATEIYPQFTEAFYEMGRIYLQQNRKEEARKAFEQAIVATPWLQELNNRPQQLLETSNEILQLYPTLSVGHFFQSFANLSLGRLEEAEKSALRADQHEHRQMPQVHLLLAKIYRQKGKLEEAGKQLSTFLEESPNSPIAYRIRFDLAMEALSAGNYEVAIAQFEEAAQLAPELSAAFANLGDAYTGAGTAKRGSDAQVLYEKAIEAYEKAIALKPDAPGYHNNLGRVLALAGNVERAEKELSTAAELAPDKGGRYFYNLGAVLTNNGRKEEAIEAFRKSTEVDSNYAMAWYQLGMHLSAEAKVDEKTGKSIPPPRHGGSAAKVLGTGA